MKKLILLASFALIAAYSFSQTVVAPPVRTRVMPSFNAGSQSAFGTTGYTISGTGTADTLAVTDTIQYVYPVNATTQWQPLISLQWIKIGSGTATVVASFYQGNTSGNLEAVTAGTANTAYTKSLTFSATGVQLIDFLRDSVKLSGNYLGIRFTTSSTASVQGSIAGTVKTLLK